MGRLVNFYPASIGKAERHLEVSELKMIRATQASQAKLADYLAALHECEEAEERVNEATTETLPELKADHEAKTACMLALRAEHAELKSAEDKADQVEDEAHERLGTLEDEYEAYKKHRKNASSF